MDVTGNVCKGCHPIPFLRHDSPFLIRQEREALRRSRHCSRNGCWRGRECCGSDALRKDQNRLVSFTVRGAFKSALTGRRIDDAKQARRFKSSSHAVTVLVESHGIQELYRGLVSTTLKQTATSAVRMGTYNVLRELVKSHGITPTVVTNFGVGALAGMVIVYATQPLDTVKTRAQGVHGAGVVEAIRSVTLEHGFRGFWKGSTMRLGRLLLSGGIVFSVYEELAAVLSRPTVS